MLRFIAVTSFLSAGLFAAVPANAQVRWYGFDGVDASSGRYQVRIPGGFDFRIDVGDIRDNQRGRRGGDLESLAENLHERVRDLQLVLTHQGQIQPYVSEILQAREFLKAFTDAVDDGDEPARVLALLQRFDEIWHPLADHLIDHYGPASPVGQHVTLANQADETIHRILNVPPAVGPVRDDPRVIYAGRVAETAQSLADELEWRIGRGREHEAIAAAAYLAQAAQNLGDELVRDPAPGRNQREIRLVREWSAYLDEQLQTLNRYQFAEAFGIAAQLRDDVARLERSLH